MRQRFQIIVVGAGQAGLAIGHFLKQQDLHFVILDSATEIGTSWRNRWDSLRLFTPSQYDALPGLPFPAPYDTYPGKDEVANYLKDYAERFDLPVRLNTRVTSLAREDSGYRVRTDATPLFADQVVVATGPFQRPFVPDLATDLAPDVVQLHSSDYRNPEALPPGEVLVVGAGNSGMQIAQELAASRKVHLSQGRVLPTVPLRILGRSLFWWLKTSGLMKVPAHSAFGKRMRANDEVVIGARPTELLRSGRLVLLPRAVRAEGSRVGFADGRTLEVRTVVWATGYRSDYRWIDLPVFGEHGQPVHHRGVTASSGLYFLGLPWQHTTGSALLGWMARDAAFLAEQIRDFQRRH